MPVCACVLVCVCACVCVCVCVCVCACVCYDVAEDVHWNPWYSDAHPYVEWQTLYGRAFVLGRSDWEYIFNT